MQSKSTQACTSVRAWARAGGGRGGDSGAAATSAATGQPGPHLSPLALRGIAVWIEIFTSVTSSGVDPCLADKIFAPAIVYGGWYAGFCQSSLPGPTLIPNTQRTGLEVLRSWASIGTRTARPLSWVKEA